MDMDGGRYVGVCIVPLGCLSIKRMQCSDVWGIGRAGGTTGAGRAMGLYHFLPIPKSQLVGYCNHWHM